MLLCSRGSRAVPSSSPGSRPVPRSSLSRGAGVSLSHRGYRQDKVNLFSTKIRRQQHVSEHVHLDSTHARKMYLHSMCRCVLSLFLRTFLGRSVGTWHHRYAFCRIRSTTPVCRSKADAARQRNPREPRYASVPLGTPLRKVAHSTRPRLFNKLALLGLLLHERWMPPKNCRGLGTSSRPVLLGRNHPKNPRGAIRGRDTPRTSLGRPIASSHTW